MAARRVAGAHLPDVEDLQAMLAALEARR